MLTALLLLLVLLGHGFLWIGLVNRLHAMGMRRWIIKSITFGMFLCAAAIPTWAAVEFAIHRERMAAASWFAAIYDNGFPWAYYAGACCLAALVTVGRLIWLRWPRRCTTVERYYGRQWAPMHCCSAAHGLEETAHHALVHLPFNEILRLEISQRILEIPRLPSALDGFSIVHLSDLHFTGRVGKAYFRDVVRISNEFQPDLVAITGDIVDSASCLGWIGDTLAQLTARHGVYFILGNHDLRVDPHNLRRLLQEHGLVSLGGCWKQVFVGGQPITLGGNERPWFDGGDDGSAFDAREDALRIVLAHSPDQWRWARKRRADVMLVGHTHAGQIRIPPFGAIFSPTFQGVRYLSGIYHLPPTVMHVSRGISGDIPIRWRCPPELARLTLRTKKGQGGC